MRLQLVPLQCVCSNDIAICVPADSLEGLVAVPPFNIYEPKPSYVTGLPRLDGECRTLASPPPPPRPALSQAPLLPTALCIGVSCREIHVTCRSKLSHDA